MAEVNEVNLSQRGTMAEGEGGGGGLIKIIIIAVVALILIGGGTVGAIWFLSSGGEEAAEETTVSDAAAAIADRGVCPQESLAYVDLGSFVVNLADGRRYLKANLQLKLCDEAIEPLTNYLTSRQAEIKDLVVSELQTLTTEQLRDQRERELLRQRLLSRIESLLPNKDREWERAHPIEKVLITEFYLQ